MRLSRDLIVNADDLGQSPAVNRGILTAHKNGIVTSASLMVRWPHAAAAAAAASDCPALSLGIHLDFGEWVLRGDEWKPLYEVTDLDDLSALENELENQFATFERLVGAGPTHCDSHQHVHRRSPLRELVIEAGRKRRIPVRHFSDVRYCGDFYGQNADGSPLKGAIEPQALLHIIEKLPEGVTELACHPADGDDLDTMYRGERIRELRALCDPRVRNAAEEAGVRLVSFGARS